MQAKVELGHDGKDERKCGSGGTGRRRQVSSVFNFLGPLIQADDTRLFSLGYSRRSESSDPGGVAGATLVKIAIFSVNPVTKTGPLSIHTVSICSWMFAGQRMYMMHMLLLPFLPITALIIQVTFEFYSSEH